MRHIRAQRPNGYKVELIQRADEAGGGGLR
jgi:hypothetical protein